VWPRSAKPGTWRHGAFGGSGAACRRWQPFLAGRHHLAALVLQATVTGTPPLTLADQANGVEPTTQRQLRQVAADAGAGDASASELSARVLAG
jgi:hypothetical protein